MNFAEPPADSSSLSFSPFSLGRYSQNYAMPTEHTN